MINNLLETENITRDGGHQASQEQQGSFVLHSQSGPELLGDSEEREERQEERGMFYLWR